MLFQFSYMLRKWFNLGQAAAVDYRQLRKSMETASLCLLICKKFDFH